MCIFNILIYIDEFIIYLENKYILNNNIYFTFSEYHSRYFQE